jgi:hypothetical protein
MDQDAFDDRLRFDEPHASQRRFHHVFIDPAVLADLRDELFACTPLHDVGVERVDECIGLGVITEQRLADTLKLVTSFRAGGEERRQLVTELIAEGAKAKAQHVLEVRL